MAISPTPGPGLIPGPSPLSADDGGSIHFCEFTLMHGPEPRQVGCRRANPLCALLAATREGAHVCDRGCGIGGDAAAAGRHVCPFGMAMQRLPEGPAPGQSRWLGRRFTSVGALHAALDLLAAEGFDEETILEHLPANPVVDEATLAEVARGRASAEVIPLVATEPAATRPAPAERNETAAEVRPAPVPTPAGAMLEFLGQLHHLLATADQTAKACERFVKVALAPLPAVQSAVLLRRREKPEGDGPARLGEELVLAAANPARAAAGRAAAQGPLSAHELGPIVLASGTPMIERGGKIEIYQGESAAGAVVGVPIAVGGASLGVWLVRLGAEAGGAGWAEEPLRLMRLQAEFLASRLTQVMATPAAGGEAKPEKKTAKGAPKAAAGPAAWGEEELAAALRPEVARAQRLGTLLMLAEVRIASDRGEVRLPVAALERAMGRALRPYDRVAMDAAADGHGWHAIVTQLGPDQIERVASRLQATVEDVLDANGGLEERGLRVGLGVSLLGVDAADAAELAAHAAHAARLAAGEADSGGGVYGGVRVYEAPEHAVG